MQLMYQHIFIFSFFFNRYLNTFSLKKRTFYLKLYIYHILLEEIRDKLLTYCANSNLKKRCATGLKTVTE